jgi:hypothetical protein
MHSYLTQKVLLLYKEQLLTLYREIIAVYYLNHKQHTKKFYEKVPSFTLKWEVHTDVIAVEVDEVLFGH